MWMIDDTYRVYVQKLGENTKQTIPRLQPLSSKTVMQIFGYESDIYGVSMKVVGYDDHNAIKAMAKDGTTHTITETPPSGSGFSGWNKTIYISSFSSDRTNSMIQTMRGDLSCYAPVFDVELEVYFDG